MNRYLSFVIKTASAALIPIILFSCAPVNLYTINMNYIPSKTIATGTDNIKKIQLTVARFIDARNIQDTMLIGTVESPDGGMKPVLPKYSKPVDTVTAGIREYLSAAGYSLSPQIPVWDLKNDSIEKRWGSVLIGGTIDKLEITCRREGVKKNYQANVKLTVVFADVRNARIFHRMEIETSPSLIHVRFSEKILEEQINKALSDSIEKVFGSVETIQNIIGEL
ncbi:MAG TPA: hypothetical protein PKZ42_11635 [Syntrophales bacterium]|nr:hypothetical protein [Syntrophales bacterium]